MSLSADLWRENRDLARKALEHPFVAGLGSGQLSLVSFRHYVAQDAFFLESFARAYALALSRSPDRAGLGEFAALISGVLEELDLHDAYARRWGVSLAGVEPSDATLAYTDFLLRTAALEDVGLTCAAMTPCMRLYAYLGRELAEREGGGPAPDNPYAEWIETYSDPEFEGLARTLEGLLDRYAPAREPGGRAVNATYRRAMTLEVAFFEAAYRQG
ncbi:Putative transcription activator [Rubrobacter radiotolerans]|uniref:Putative transcription activator n=1 Tax=Rubrobacter radiotolerans TaxID=42256 RepID=A0A023X1H4_RUBRA|nr:TenA family protein [Rubrobacter radiotolerans]AHY45865.1 Putative transcription activator [Rubrobacter radiotolerans]MDX5893279.1 TenA family protein [Rubrobacter radiotolerans]SMC03415.1 thiaminase (transcriptional activator TenA) [Rubrobacter radiotolerans DSM 5868]